MRCSADASRFSTSPLLRVKVLFSRLRVSRHFPWVLAVLIALAHVVMAITATIGKCVAFDEIAHITGGQSYWQHHDFRLQPENGMLPQRLAGLPVLFRPWRLPSASAPAWGESNVWEVGKSAFYRMGNDTEFMVLLSRCAVSVHAFGIVLLVFGWSRRLFGLAGAATSLALCVFCPTLLAHGPLATSDVAMAFWMLAASGAYWRFLNAPTWGNGLLAGVCLGFAAVAKFSAVLLAPIWIGLWIARSAFAAPVATTASWAVRGTKRTAVLLAASLAQVALAVGIVWLFFEFRVSPFGPTLQPGEYLRTWTEVMQLLGSKSALFAWLRENPLLPDAYTYGLTSVLAYSQSRAAFLNGEVSIDGWVTFFPYAFLVKTPLPLLLALAVGCTVLVKQGLPAGKNAKGSRLAGHPVLWALAPLIAVLIVYWAASLTSRLNIGHRHLLPIYPPLFILAGAAGRWAWRRRWPGRLALGATLLWSAATAHAIRPHYLAYFNAFAGGPTQAYHHLVDSSLDWGMDLPALADWLKANVKPGEEVSLAYFGMGNPTYEGIKARKLPSFPPLEVPVPTRLHPGVYAISATILQQPYSPVNGPWTAERERVFKQLSGLEALARRWEENRHELPTLAKEHFVDDDGVRGKVWKRYEALRFARLCHYLRTRQPEAQIGYSIFVYHVTEAQLQAAVHGSLADFVRLVESGDPK